MKKYLVIGGTNAHAPLKFSEKSGGRTFNCTRCGVVNYAVTSMPNFHRQLKVLRERGLLKLE